MTVYDAAAALGLTISKAESSNNIIGFAEAIYPQVGITARC